MIRVILAVALMGFGVFSIGVSVLGLLRYTYVLNRIHAAALTDTLGVLGVLSGLILLCGWSVLSVKLVIVLVFMWLTGPVATHLIGKTELLTEFDLDVDAPHEEGEQLM